MKSYHRVFLIWVAVIDLIYAIVSLSIWPTAPTNVTLAGFGLAILIIALTVEEIE